MRIPCVPRTAARFALTTLLFSLSLAPQISAADAVPPPPSSDVVELPTLSVTDTRELPQPEKWRYTRIGNFEAISSASDRESRRLLRDFEMFRLALGIAWPMEFRQPPPSSIILCGRTRDFQQFLPPQEKKSSDNRASLTLNNHEQAFIVLDLATKTIALDPSTIEISADAPIPTDFDVDHYKQLYREYVRYLFSQSVNRPPVWLEEGLCQIVMSMEFDKRLIIFGRIDNPNEVSAAQAMANSQNQAAVEAGDTPSATAPVEDLDFNAALKRRRLLDFDAFFGVDRDAEVARNPLGNNAWAKQSYAFVHMCLYGRGGRYKEAFNKFSQRAAKERATEAMFEECFGKPYKKFLTDLRGYIEFTDYKYQQIKITGKETLETPLPEMRDATEGEYTRIKGDAFRLAGNTAAARDALVAAYIRGERDQPFLSTLGQAELAAGNTERARKFLEVSALKSTRPSVLVDLARLRLDEARANPASPNKKLSATQLGSVLKPLFVARALPPPRADVYELIAAAWLAAEPAPKPENLSVLTEGLKLFPRNTALVYNTASLFAHNNNAVAARALAEHGEKIAPTDADRARFTQLKATLP
jgi:hypothetical protein